MLSRRRGRRPENRIFEQLNSFFLNGVGYGVQMGTRPQAMYGLADSPIALAAWMINHDAGSYQDIAAAFAGHPVGNLTRDEIPNNVTFAWLTNTGGFLRAPVLGEHGRLLRREEPVRAGRREHLPA